MIAEPVAQFFQFVDMGVLFFQDIEGSDGSVGDDKEAVVRFLEKDFPRDHEIGCDEDEVFFFLRK